MVKASKPNNFQKDAIEHLIEWKEHIFPGVEKGIWKHKGNDKAHGHILPLTQCSKRVAVERWNLLSDAERKYLKGIKLHQYAHHLNSSQILCVNFFGRLLGEKVSKGIWKATPELTKLIYRLVGKNLQVDKTECQFEYLDEISNQICKYDGKTENTNFDFHIRDDQHEVFFEIKYTERGFGKAKHDERHRAKFNEIYKPLVAKLLNSQGEYVDINKFFDFYQIFRNLLRLGENRFVVFLYPMGNDCCQKEVDAFLTDFPQFKSCFHKWEELGDFMSDTFKAKYFPG